MRRKRPALLKGDISNPLIIILCVRGYPRFSLSLRNVEEPLVELLI
jgi:hypothetical protein